MPLADNCCGRSALSASLPGVKDGPHPELIRRELGDSRRVVSASGGAVIELAQGRVASSSVSLPSAKGDTSWPGGGFGLPDRKRSIPLCTRLFLHLFCRW